jgi:protein-S-isoprenylcysteine O-methyltransferase Ste14
VDGLAKALGIPLGSGPMAANGDQPHEPIDRRRLAISTTASMLILVLCLFLPAGTWAWSRGWLFLVVVTAASLLSTLYLRRVNPDVIAGRVNRHEGTKRWDRILVVIALPTLMAIPILAALDDGRFHWSHLPWWGCLAGYALMIAGFFGVTWATSMNKFFEPSVRIQTDRGHRVIDAGPCAIIRHPGYALSYPLFLGMPLALGSLWALIPALFFGLFLIVRTALEDRTLQEELPGYEEYAQRVRYSLIPGVW